MRSAPRRQGGLTLVELLIVLAIVGTLATVAIPAFIQTLHGIKVKKAIAEITTISFEVKRFERRTERWPDDLFELDRVPITDPWGRPYVYLHSDAADWNGKRRRDRWMNPLNFDFDVFSVGPDGDSQAPLPPPASHDDIIRANSGGYVGEAWKF